MDTVVKIQKKFLPAVFPQGRGEIIKHFEGNKRIGGPFSIGEIISLILIKNRNSYGTRYQ